jgi:hypothetical protein
MRHGILIAIFCLIAAEAANAQQKRPDTALPSETATTRIEVDATSNTIRFFIDGDEQAILDAGGLHVKGSIDYGGAITDGNQHTMLPHAKPEAQ